MWFRYISTKPEVKLKLNQQPYKNSTKNVYRVLVQWLDLVDSFKDRAVIILHSCGLSYKKIIELYPERRWTETTLGAHYNDIIEKLVYDLNHIEELKYPIGTNFDEFE